MTEVNGQPAVVIRGSGLVFSVLMVEVEAAQIRAVHVMANPEKLAGVQ